MPQALAATATQARRLAAGLGYPVMLTVVSPDITLTVEAGGVCVDVGSADEVARAFDTVVVNAFRFKPGARVVGVRVQAMAPLAGDRHQRASNST